MNENELKQMQELVTELNKHCYNYYVMDNPTISDYEYDRMYDRLQEMEKKFNTVLPESPSRRVGGQVLDGFKKVKHKVKVYSLDKVTELEALKKWANDIIAVYPNVTFTVDYKYDGLNLCVLYNHGVLEKAVTRGNGIEGEDVTQQVITIKSLPLKIEYKKELIVQGEGLMFLSDLERYNKTASEPLKNVRNGVAGAIRNLDPKETAKRNLNMFLYNVQYIEDKGLIKSQTEINEFLIKNGFMCNRGNLCKTAEDVCKFVEQINISRHELDYLTDGAVVKVNELSIRNELGETIKYPRWAMAFKFEAEEISTRLIDVVWQVGRTGKVTPTAVLEPVTLAGALISRATLNNESDIVRKQVQCPSRVFVRRSNEVIPEILGLAELEAESKPIHIPTNCPCCDMQLSKIGANLFCTNKDCREQIQNKIVHFCTKDAMNIEGVSDKTIEQFYDKLNVRKVSDLYKITSDDLEKLDGYKDKKISNFLNNIERSKNINLSNFIYALSISNVGKKTAKDLASTFGSFGNIINAKREDIASIYDVGDVVADCVVNFFKNEYNMQIIEELLNSGIQIMQENQMITESVFTKKKCVLTGTLSRYTRNEATALLERLGAQVLSSVSSACDYVIAGESAGSKLVKARNLGVTILNEDEFIKLLNS